MSKNLHMSLIFVCLHYKKISYYDDRSDTFTDHSLVDENQRGAGSSYSRAYVGAEENVGTDSEVPASDVRTRPLMMEMRERLETEGIRYSQNSLTGKAVTYASPS